MMNNRKFRIAHLENILCPLQKPQGFALIWLCTLLPVILMAIIFIYAGTIQIEMRSTLHQLCRRELLTAQAQSSQIIRKIMMHNQTNRGVKNAFEVASQQELLSELVKHSQLSLNKGKLQIQKTLLDFQHKLTPLMEVSGIEVIGLPHSAPSIQINFYFLLEHSDSTQLKKNFERLQSITLSWKYQLKLSSNFIIENSWSQNFEGHCSATLKKEKPWPPILYEDKFFWKPS